MNREPKSDYKKTILNIVALGGILAVGAIAPNCLQLLKYTKTNKRKKKYYINSVVRRLIQNGYLKYGENRKGQKVVRLTKKGEKVLEEYMLTDSLNKLKTKNWDGKYRVIIFDIKEQKRKTRDRLREWLVKIGMFRLQNSVWVFPYDCEDIITLLKANYKIGKEVLYMKVDYIEQDRKLKEFFNLN